MTDKLRACCSPQLAGIHEALRPSMFGPGATAAEPAPAPVAGATTVPVATTTTTVPASTVTAAPVAGAAPTTPAMAAAQ